MKNRKPLPADALAEPTEIAEVRAEVRRALASDPPDLGVLTTALDRVDVLIAQAQDELIAAVRELQSAGAAPRAATREFLAMRPLGCVRDLLPW